MNLTIEEQKLKKLYSLVLCDINYLNFENWKIKLKILYINYYNSSNNFFGSEFKYLTFNQWIDKQIKEIINYEIEN